VRPPSPRGSRASLSLPPGRGRVLSGTAWVFASAGAGDRARWAIEEFLGATETSEDLDPAPYAASLVRAAVEIGDGGLAARVMKAVGELRALRPRLPVLSARAMLAEHAGDGKMAVHGRVVPTELHRLIGTAQLGIYAWYR